jgi:hypothetical protein
MLASWQKSTNVEEQEAIFKKSPFSNHRISYETLLRFLFLYHPNQQA